MSSLSAATIEQCAEQGPKSSVIEDVQENKCGICHEEPPTCEVILPCSVQSAKHIYCHYCIKKWARERIKNNLQPACPVCIVEIPTNDLEKILLPDPSAERNYLSAEYMKNFLRGGVLGVIVLNRFADANDDYDPQMENWPLTICAVTFNCFFRDILPIMDVPLNLYDPVTDDWYDWQEKYINPIGKIVNIMHPRLFPQLQDFRNNMKDPI